MTALAYHEGTVLAHPLGIPLDGSNRYGMTPAMARLYRWLVHNRPHSSEFSLSFRDASEALGADVSSIHYCAVGLEERGWLRRFNRRGHHPLFAFIHPVMNFRECTEISPDE